MPQARFVFSNQRSTDNEVALFDTRRGRNEIIAMVDMDYVPLFEKLLNPPPDFIGDPVNSVVVWPSEGTKAVPVAS